MFSDVFSCRPSFEENAVKNNGNILSKQNKIIYEHFFLWPAPLTVVMGVFVRYPLTHGVTNHHCVFHGCKLFYSTENKEGSGDSLDGKTSRYIVARDVCDRSGLRFFLFISQSYYH